MQTKKEFRFFTIFQYEQEQEYLRRRHQQGWKFVKVTGVGVYHFEKCVPEDVVYQLDYNKDATESREEYLTMFADCGWEFLQMYAGYSYFRKPASQMAGEEAIFSDGASHLAMMERVLRGRMLPLFVIFSACLMPQFILNISNGRYVVASFLGGILLLYVFVFAGCGIYYMKLKRKYMP